MGIIAAIGIILIVLRFFFRKTLQGFSFTSQHISISRMKNKPERAIAYAESLDMPFSKKKDIGNEAFQLICSRLQSLTCVGDYTLLFTQRIDASQLLLMTELTYNDYVVDLKGNTYDTK